MNKVWFVIILYKWIWLVFADVTTCEYNFDPSTSSNIIIERDDRQNLFNMEPPVLYIGVNSMWQSPVSQVQQDDNNSKGEFYMLNRYHQTNNFQIVPSNKASWEKVWKGSREISSLCGPSKRWQILDHLSRADQTLQIPVDTVQ